MTRLAKPATVRFYFDADVLGLARVLVGLRPDLTYPGDPGGIVHRRERAPCPVTSTSVADVDRIPEVTQRGWLIITRDSRIQDHPADVEVVRSNGARMVALAGSEARGVWDQLEVLMSQWRAIELRANQAGPFIYSATRTRLRAVPLT